MPTETKKSTAKASRSGSASAAAWWLTGDWATIMPARNAPRAIDAPNTAYEPAAIAIEKTITVSVNSSRERSRATCTRTQGTTREPASITIATRAASLSSASPTAAQRPGPAAPPAAGRIGPEHGDQHQDDDRQHVLDEQPPDGDVALAANSARRRPSGRASARRCSPRPSPSESCSTARRAMASIISGDSC